MVTVVGKEWSHVCSHGDGVVVREFGEGKKERPIGLKVVRIHSEVLFDNCVNPFCLAVRLRMERGRQILLDVELQADVTPEGGGEECASVRDDILGETMQAVYVLFEDPCEITRCIG